MWNNRDTSGGGYCRNHKEEPAAVYWLNIALLGTTLYFSWVCAPGAGLVKPDLPAEIQVAIKRRIVTGQSLYAFGALLCVFLNTYWSIGFIVLVQLNYAIAPRIGFLERL